MSTSSTGSLSAGVQQLYNDGLLPLGVSTNTLNGASASQLNKMVASSVAMQEVGTILGFGNSSSAGDSASLSSTATNALLQEINPSSSSTTSSSTDPLTSAVDNALTTNIDAAVNKFAPPSLTTTGSQINLLG